MTVFGWDASHYDGALTVADLQRAKSEGIVLFTHKVGEGLGNLDPLGTEALNAARSAGMPVIGAYWFGHNADDPKAEAGKFLAVLDLQIPWWRQFPNFILQADCETEAGQGKPSATWQKTFCDTLGAESGCLVFDYASRGEYGRISVGHPMWNANYGTNPRGPFATVYPGDHSPGWTGYPDTPTLLQFGSNTTIAGKTTCDANAYRGTVEALLTLTERADMALTDADVQKIWAYDGIANWRSDAKTNPSVQAGHALGFIGAGLPSAASIATSVAAALAPKVTGMTEEQIQQAIVDVLGTVTVPAAAPPGPTS
jgi:glycosyl hydrolase family 25